MPVQIDRRDIQNLSKLELLAKQAVEGFITGMHKSPFHGFSVEFAEHRQYNTGESTRHLDWKLLARTEKHFVKRYEEETNLRCHILLDNSSSMFFPSEVSAESKELNKIKFAVYGAAALIEMLKNQRDAVGLSVFGDKIELNTRAGSSGVHINFLFNELEKILSSLGQNPTKNSFVVDTLHEIAESIHRRSLVVIFSDMMDNSSKSDELFAALRHLKHNKHEVILFHVIDRSKEELFEFENRPYTFIDLENGAEIRVNPADIRDSYKKNYEKFKNELKLKCGAYAIDFVEADINEGYNSILMQYFIKRQKMKTGGR